MASLSAGANPPDPAQNHASTHPGASHHRRTGLADPTPPAHSAIRHLIVLVQENHSFDSYFARYCQAASGSQPTCTQGAGCCEAGPAQEPGTGIAPTLLDDAANTAYDPDHSQGCELEEIDGGKMDKFAKGTACSDPRNFAYATRETARTYWEMAEQGALADRYFQPVAGASSSNDMYLARAQYVFTDNQVEPDAIGSACGGAPNENRRTYTDPTIGDLLSGQGVSWAYYAEGYHAARDAVSRGTCPQPDAGCPLGIANYPCIYDPSDNPFQYYRSTLDNLTVQKDLTDLEQDLARGTLPAVSFAKALGYRTEHPGSDISAGMGFVGGVLRAVQASRYAADTLVLVTFDESGGFFDHIAPPAPSRVDGQPYGPRVPLLAAGPFARHGVVSHVPMEHASIVRFIEWNWLGGQTGQLHGRDATVNNLGSLLEPALTGTPIPVR